MRPQRSKNHRSGSVKGSHPSLCRNPAEIQRIRNNGVSKGEEQPNDLRPTCKSQIQVRQQTLLVPRLLRRYSRKERKTNQGICSEPVTGGHSRGPVNAQGIQ